VLPIFVLLVLLVLLVVFVLLAFLVVDVYGHAVSCSSNMYSLLVHWLLHMHWLLLRITLTHHRLLLRVAAHWLLLGISSHWLLLRVGSHRLLLGVGSHWLLMSRLDCYCRANLSAGDLTISVYEHGWLHALRSMTKGSTTGFPNASEMNDSCLFSFEEKLEPFVRTAADAQGGYLDFGRSDQIVLAQIIVPDRQLNVVSDVLDIDCKHFTLPIWLLASFFANLCPDFLLSGLHNDIWVHLAECFGIAGESCLVDMNLKNSLSCHGFILLLSNNLPNILSNPLKLNKIQS